MTTPYFLVGDKRIGGNVSPFVIAEIGINHGGDVDLAHKMISVAADCGADAIKLQTFQTSEFLAKSSPYYEMIGSCKLPSGSLQSLNDHAQDLGITIFSAVFDEQSADDWASLDALVYKVASGDLTHLPLLRHIAAKGRPVIMSTGGGTMVDIQSALDAMRSVTPSLDVAILHCVSLYPTDPNLTNLACMATMEKAFNVPVGFSDHTLGSVTAVSAVALGASIIEKHFTLDRSMDGPDHAMSCDPDGFRQMVDDIRTAHQTIGSSEKAPVEPSDHIAQIRRSLTARRDIHTGQTIAMEDLAIKRPGGGILPDDIVKVVGRVSQVDVPMDATLQWDMFREALD